MVSSKEILGAGGGFAAGLLLLGGGLVVKHAQARTLAECSTGLGQIGQVLNSNAASKCSTAQDLTSMATVTIWIGVIVLAIAVGGLVALLIASGARAGGNRSKTVVPGTSAAPPAADPRAPMRPQPGGGPVLRPIVPVVVGQENSAPLDDRQRDLFATASAASGSGSEITTVLPIFAPAEPFDLTAPARVPGRPSERSLAGVGTGPQARLADYPAPAAPPFGLADQPMSAVPQARRADYPAPAGSPFGLAGRPAPPVPPAGLAARPAAPPVPPAGLAAAPVPPARLTGDPAPPLARSADRPPATRRVRSSPPWELADQPLIPGSTVSPAPPWAQTERPPAVPAAPAAPAVLATPQENVSPGPPWAQTERPPAVPAPFAAPQENVSPGPPWAQTERPPLARQEGGSSGPPWERAEHLPTPSGASREGDSASQRHSGRHRSRRP
jgi:hypothetical protein